VLVSLPRPTEQKVLFVSFFTDPELVNFAAEHCRDWRALAVSFVSTIFSVRGMDPRIFRFCRGLFLKVKKSTLMRKHEVYISCMFEY
jgi:hypothetical protein